MSSYSPDVSRSGSCSPLFGTATESAMTLSPPLPGIPILHAQVRSFLLSKVSLNLLFFNGLYLNVWHYHTPIFSLCDVMVLFVADMVSQASLLMTVISLEMTCVGSQSCLCHPTGILVWTCIVGLRMTPFETRLR